MSFGVIPDSRQLCNEMLEHFGFPRWEVCSWASSNDGELLEQCQLHWKNEVQTLLSPWTFQGNVSPAGKSCSGDKKTGLEVHLGKAGWFGNEGLGQL